jgi:hypothetical protein
MCNWIWNTTQQRVDAWCHRILRLLVLGENSVWFIWWFIWWLHKCSFVCWFSPSLLYNFVIRLDFRCTPLLAQCLLIFVVSLLLRPFILNLLMDLCLASYFQFLNLYPPQLCYLEVAAALLAFWSPIKVIKLCHSFWYKMLINLVARYDNACTTYFHLSFSWLNFFRLILNCLYNIVSSSHIVLVHLQHS